MQTLAQLGTIHYTSEYIIINNIYVGVAQLSYWLASAAARRSCIRFNFRIL